MATDTLPTLESIVEKVAGAQVAKAADAPVTEVAKEPEAPTNDPTPVAPPKKDLQSSRFAELAKRDKAARQRDEQVAAREKAIEAREKASQEREAKLVSAKRNPIQLLKEHGYSYQDATEAVLGNYKEPEEDPVDAKLKPYNERFSQYESNTEALKSQLEDLKSQIFQREQQDAYKTVMGEIKTALKDTERYELINAIGEDAESMVRDVIGEYARVHKRWMDYNEACDIVEKHYEDAYLSRLSGTKKFTSKLPKPVAPPTKSPAKTGDNKSAERATLTNNMSTGLPDKIDVDKLSKDDAIEVLMRKHNMLKG